MMFSPTVFVVMWFYWRFYNKDNFRCAVDQNVLFLCEDCCELGQKLLSVVVVMDQWTNLEQGLFSLFLIVPEFGEYNFQSPDYF